MRALLADYGARLIELWTPDRDGDLDDVVLGLPTLEGYRAARSFYLGSTIGRVANRIRNARFTLDGVTYGLTANEPPNHLHGGGDLSFGERSWSMDEPPRPDSVTFGLVSNDLEEGYPGALQASVTFTITDGNELVIDFLAEPDRRTPVALTHHSYWNLGGHRSLRDILGHEVWVDASTYAPTDEERVPTGLIVPVAHTPLDFRVPTPVGARIGLLLDQPAHGYDHSLVLDGRDPSKGEPRLAARLHDPITGRVMELSTTEPALQLYSGQALPSVIGKHGARYMPHAGIALEPEGIPNAVNEPRFPSVIVEPGAPYRQRSVYRFSVE